MIVAEWRGHLALSFRLLAAAFAQLRLQPLVLRGQILQLLLQRRAFCLHAVQKVAVDVVLGKEGRMGGGYGLAKGLTVDTKSFLETASTAHLRLKLHHALPQLTALRQSLGLAQTHAHQLVLQLAQDQLPRGLLPAAAAGQMGLSGEASGQPRSPEGSGLCGCTVASCPLARPSPARCLRAPAAAASAPGQWPPLRSPAP